MDPSFPIACELLENSCPGYHTESDALGCSATLLHLMRRSPRQGLRFSCTRTSQNTRIFTGQTRIQLVAYWKVDTTLRLALCPPMSGVPAGLLPGAVSVPVCCFWPDLSIQRTDWLSLCKYEFLILISPQNPLQYPLPCWLTLRK